MKKLTWKRGTKIVSFVLSALLITGVFNGCGNKATDKDDQGRTMIYVSPWPANQGKELDAMNERKNKFESNNPDVVVLGDTWKFDLKTFYPKAAAGRLPTIYNANFTEASQIIAAGYSSDITDVLEKHGILDKFSKQILDIVSKDGRVYAFPTNVYALGMGCNIDMFEKAGLMEPDGTPKQPKDWNEVAEFAVKIKEATGKPGLVLPTSANNGGWIFTPIAWSFGVNFMEKDSDGKWHATFDCPEMVEALQWVKDLKWKYDVLPANSLIDNTEYYKTFCTGNAGMLICTDSTDQAISYDMKAEQLGMLAMPSGPKKHVTLMGGYLHVISNKATDDQIEAATKWIETSFNYKLTDQYKESTDKTIDVKRSNGGLIGQNSMSVWNENAETVAYEREQQEKKANINLNHVKLYNDFISNLGDCELRPEEPVCAQELYGILDSCIQEILTNKDADISELVRKANKDFQENYLDNVDY